MFHESDNNQCLLSIYCVPGATLCAFHTFSHLIFTTALCSTCNYCPHFIFLILKNKIIGVRLVTNI